MICRKKTDKKTLCTPYMQKGKQYLRFLGEYINL